LMIFRNWVYSSFDISVFYDMIILCVLV
jgi:hypothetical protein